MSICFCAGSRHGSVSPLTFRPAGQTEFVKSGVGKEEMNNRGNRANLQTAKLR